MTGFSIFTDFVDILSNTFQLIFVPKYLILFLGIGCVLGVSIIRMFLRWFNA